MNVASITHQLAMDISTLGELSKAKGFLNEAQEYFAKAYEFEKQAAFMIKSTEADSLSHFIYLRSAAALAYHAGLFQESEKLIEVCLSENPPTFIVEDLKEITDLMKTESFKTGSKIRLNLKIEGFLTKVNIEENEITIKDDIQEQQYSIIVSKKQLPEIIKNYWFQKVLLHVKQTNFGTMILENIKVAA